MVLGDFVGAANQQRTSPTTVTHKGLHEVLVTVERVVGAKLRFAQSEKPMNPAG